MSDGGGPFGGDARFRVLVGQLVCLLGSLVLLVFVPFTPLVSGAPVHRLAEMCIFWAAYWLMIGGTGLAHSALTLPPVPDRLSPVAAARLASLGMMIAALVCFASLSNLTFSTLQGVGFRPPGIRSTSWPEIIGYCLSLPLLAAAACQIPLLVVPKSVVPVAPARRFRVTRLLLLLALGGLTCLFALSCAAVALERRWIVVPVVLTWLSSPVFAAVGLEQLLAGAGDRPNGTR